MAEKKTKTKNSFDLIYINISNSKSSLSPPLPLIRTRERSNPRKSKSSKDEADLVAKRPISEFGAQLSIELELICLNGRKRVDGGGTGGGEHGRGWRRAG